MKILKKIGGALAIAGLGAVAFAGTICISVGTPLFVVGLKKQNKLIDDFTKTEQYQTWREEEDKRLEEIYNETVVWAEEAHNNGKISDTELKRIQNSYNETVKESNTVVNAMYTIGDQDYINQHKENYKLGTAGVVLGVIGVAIIGMKALIRSDSNEQSYNVAKYCPKYHDSVGVSCLAKQRQIIDKVFKDKTESRDK